MARKSEGPWFRESKNCWYVWHQGKQVRLHSDKEEAKRRWRLLLAGQPPEPAATDPPPPTPQAPPPLTVGTLIDAYLADAALRLKPSTIISKSKVLLRLKADKGKEPAATLKPAVVTAWLGKQRWGRSLRWLAASIVKTLYRWAADPKQGLLAADPTQGLKLPSPLSRGTEAIASAEEHTRLLAAAPECHRNALEALHATGCRPGELCAVEARHFDAKAGAWLLDTHKTDGTGKVRVILLPPALVALCKTLAAKYPTGPLFRNTKGKALTPERLRNWLYKTRRRLSLRRIVAYGYRHGLATDALVNGVPDAQVAALLGHSGTTMLHKHYSHLTAQSQVLRDALGKVR